MTEVVRDPSVQATHDAASSLLDIALPLLEHWKLWLLGSLAAGLAALGIAFVVAPVFTARTTFVPPQQQASFASALASLSGLAGLASLTGLAPTKSPADQFIALMQSVTVEDKLVERFKLLEVYDEKYRVEARRELEKNTRMSVGKKDGLIVVEVDDTDPRRAADMANAYVDELRGMTSVLAVSEAQQRRVFFERELKDARDQLTRAQQALQASGFNVGALRAEPKTSAENYARLKAEVSAAEVRLQVLRTTLADSAPDVQRQLTLVNALRAQLATQEQSADEKAGPDYVSNYREFRYRETLFELLARQYETARVDEAREGALIQVVDVALPPEKRSRPRRALVAAAATLAALLLLGAYIVARDSWRRSLAGPDGARRRERLRIALGRR